MAFRQPARQPTQRVIRIEAEDREPASQPLAPQIRSGPDESQTWVLFSPATDAGTTTSYLSLIHESQPTPGRSRLSDDGSLNTYARSDRDSQRRNSAVSSEVNYEEEAVEDDAELDSLDSHLPEFRAIPNPYSQGGQQGAAHATPVLPAHDGLGSFRIDAPGMAGADAQERLYAFERYNPRRVKRRRESLELGQLVLEDEQVEELERTRRIEAWRWEHSQFLLAEIQRETRRRRQSEASMQRLRAERSAAEDVATMSTVTEADPDTPMASSDWHDQDEPEGFWNRITRKVIRDLMGIDDRMLSILFGEALPEEDDLSSTPKASPLSGLLTPALDASESYHDSSRWQLRILERLARELGLLVHQMSTHHPGAFSAYVRMRQMPVPYAGLPVIPEAAADVSQPVVAAETSLWPEDGILVMPQFQPTIGPQEQSQPVDIPRAGAPPQPADALHLPTGDRPPAAFTQQEWEQELDIKLVFRYLRSRFTSSRSSSSQSFTAGTSHLATSSTPDAAARAARVRLHHPLVSRSRVQAERRTFKPASSPALLRHASGSCASQSTRRSARRSSVSSRHSSRHYWDIGGAGPAGSMGTGSMIASAGPMGSWGEI